MEFTTNELVENAHFSVTRYKNFDNYTALLQLARGVVSNRLSSSSRTELEKLNLLIEDDFIKNIFDFTFYIVKENNKLYLYVMRQDDRIIVGKLLIEFDNNFINFYDDNKSLILL
jgi:hypothetical protein